MSIREHLEKLKAMFEHHGSQAEKSALGRLFGDPGHRAYGNSPSMYFEAGYRQACIDAVRLLDDMIRAEETTS